MMDATPGTAAWHAIYGTSAADVTGADEEVTRLARRVVELEDALLRLLLEAIHYRNTGIGKDFLNAKIEQAKATLAR